jgi:hypothetical protein
MQKAIAAAVGSATVYALPGKTREAPALQPHFAKAA